MELHEVVKKFKKEIEIVPSIEGKMNKYEVKIVGMMDDFSKKVAPMTAKVHAAN